MKLEKYKSGNYIKMNDYKTFLPSEINKSRNWDDSKLNMLLSEANRQIGELNVRSENAKKALEVLYNEPIITRKKLMELTQLKPTAIKSIILELLRTKIITETTGYSRNQVFAFEKYINLFLK